LGCFLVNCWNPYITSPTFEESEEVISLVIKSPSNRSNIKLARYPIYGGISPTNSLLPKFMKSIFVEI
jgi:hypothetical protein